MNAMANIPLSDPHAQPAACGDTQGQRLFARADDGENMNDGNLDLEYTHESAAVRVRMLSKVLKRISPICPRRNHKEPRFVKFEGP